MNQGNTHKKDFGCKVLCEDTGCKYNSGGYYGLCTHPALDVPHYNGGIDRLYRSTCKAREPVLHKEVMEG